MYGCRLPILATLFTLSLCSGCAHNLGWVGPLIEPAIEDRGALNEAVQRYYTASTPDALRGAVNRALTIAPSAAMAHEIAAELALFEGDLERQVTHLLPTPPVTRLR
jgi:hypothetical protein